MSDLYNEVFIIVGAVFMLVIVLSHIGLAYYARKQRHLRDPNDEQNSKGAEAGYLAIIYGLHTISLGILFALALFKGIATYLCYHFVVCDVAELVFACRLFYKLKDKTTYIYHQNGDPLKTCIVVIHGLHILILGFPFGTVFKSLVLVWFEERFSLESCSPMGNLTNLYTIPSVYIFVPFYLAAIPLVILPFIVVYLRRTNSLPGWESIRHIRPIIWVIVSAGFAGIICSMIPSTVQIADILNGRGTEKFLASFCIVVLWIPLIGVVTAVLYWTTKLGYFLLFLPEFGYLWSLFLGSVGVIYRLDTGQTPCGIVQAFICVYAVFMLGHYILCISFAIRNKNEFYGKLGGSSTANDQSNNRSNPLDPTLPSDQVEIKFESIRDTRELPYFL